MARKLCMELNSAINDYQDLLELITGEVRAKVIEEIPVIDFYRPENSSLLYKYVDEEFTKIDLIPDTEDPDTFSTRTESPSFYINTAVSYKKAAEHFYGDATFPAPLTFLEIVAGYPTKTTSKAPGVLNGRLAIPTRDASNKITEWTWIDKTSEDISLGTLYSPMHLIKADGTLIIDEKPLETAESGYSGLATYYYDRFATAKLNIINNYSINSSLWNSLGGRINTVTLGTDAGELDVRDYERQLANAALRSSNRSQQNESGNSEENYDWEDQVEPKFLNEKVKYPKKLRQTYSDLWTSRNQNIGGKDWLVIDARVEADVYLRFERFQKSSTKGDRNSITAAIRDTENVHCGVALRSYKKPWLIGTTYREIDAVYLLSPFEVFRKKTDNDSVETILYNPAGDKAFNNKLLLASKTDLGFQLSSSRNLCVFFNRGEIVSFRVTAISVFNPNTLNIKVFDTAGNEFKYEHGVSSYSKPDVILIGSPCWVYTLEPLLNEITNQPDIKALAYPSEMFDYNTSGKSPLSFREYRRFQIAVGLPSLAGSEKYAKFRKNLVSFSVADRLLSTASMVNFIRKALETTTFITNNSIPVVKLNNFKSFLSKLKKNIPTMYRLLDFAPFYPDKTFFNELALFINYIENDSNFNLLTSAISSLYQSDISLDALNALCQTLDSLLGNSASPWLSISYEDTLGSSHVKASTLKEAAVLIKQLLEGEEPLEVIPSEKIRRGSVDGLYYQRYYALATRMHRTLGDLAGAAMLLKSTEVLDMFEEFESNQATFGPGTVRIIPSLKTRKIIYSVAGSGVTRGNFYDYVLTEKLRPYLEGKCVLTCFYCPEEVRSKCPFHLTAEVMSERLPKTEALEFWFQDNQLDLIAYEPDGTVNLKNSKGAYLNPNLLKDPHKTATVIQRPEDRSLPALISNINTQIPGFYNPDTGQYVENLNWLLGARYGTVVRKGENASDHRYLYDALFIKDTNTLFSYAPTNKSYEVNVALPLPDGSLDTYTGKIKMLKPVGFKAFEDLGAESQVWLTSDDIVLANGERLTPLIYLNTLRNLSIAFDFDEESDEASRIAQWNANIAKGIYNDRDQYWMTEVLANGRTYPGRETVNTGKMDIIAGAESKIGLIRKGWLPFKKYKMFIRKLAIQVSSIKWTLTGDATEAEMCKSILPLMTSGLKFIILKK